MKKVFGNGVVENLTYIQIGVKVVDGEKLGVNQMVIPVKIMFIWDGIPPNGMTTGTTTLKIVLTQLTESPKPHSSAEAILHMWL